MLPSSSSAILGPGPRVVALTGGVGCGKSQARNMFESLGVPCIDADIVARHIHQDPAHPATRQLAQAFADLMTPAGRLQRGSLHARFAVDEAANRRLKEILRPHVLATIHRWSALQDAPYVVWESALIPEPEIAVDRVVTVDAQDRHRMARIKRRNPDWSAQQIRALLAAQMPRDAYLAAAHDVLSNDGSICALQRQVEAMHQRYIALWR